MVYIIIYGNALLESDAIIRIPAPEYKRMNECLKVKERHSSRHSQSQGRYSHSVSIIRKSFHVSSRQPRSCMTNVYAG